MNAFWRSGRCPCCRKKTEIVLGPLCNETARGWDNLLSRATAQDLAREGKCPWCGRETTIVASILLRRFEPTQKVIARELCL
jgi:hypothetical protein